jgi:hypothetical protein
LGCPVCAGSVEEATDREEEEGREFEGRLTLGELLQWANSDVVIKGRRGSGKFMGTTLC